MEIPQHWRDFIKEFKGQYTEEIIAQNVHVYQEQAAIEQRYTTYEMQEYLPNYIAVADDSGGQLALIALDSTDACVYLSSTGTLIESDLEVLAPSLQQWMQQGFPFESQPKTDCLDKDALFELFIVDKGPNKMKLVSLLKSKFDLSNTQTLQMYTKERIYFCKGSITWVEKDALLLESIGASVEISKMKQ